MPPARGGTLDNTPDKNSRQRRTRDGADVDGARPELQVVLGLDPYLSLRQLAAYSSISIRTLRALLKAPLRPLPHFRLGRKIFVRRSEFDAWMAACRARQDLDLDVIVDDVLRDFQR